MQTDTPHDELDALGHRALTSAQQAAALRVTPEGDLAAIAAALTSIAETGALAAMMPLDERAEARRPTRQLCHRCRVYPPCDECGEEL